MPAAFTVYRTQRNGSTDANISVDRDTGITPSILERRCPMDAQTRFAATAYITTAAAMRADHVTS
jgi:hypothetical protein